MTLCSHVDDYQRFWKTYCLHLHKDRDEVCPKVGDSMFVQNVDNHWEVYAVPQPRRLQPELSPLWVSQMSWRTLLVVAFSMAWKIFSFQVVISYIHSALCFLITRTYKLNENRYYTKVISINFTSCCEKLMNLYMCNKEDRRQEILFYNFGYRFWP
jgi:hypothetical protein